MTQWSSSVASAVARIGWTIGLVAVATSSPARADRIENGVAVFSALDKVTATIKKLEIPLNQTVQYGALKVTPRICNSRPPAETPKTSSFVEVDEVQLDGSQTKIFSGWMFAESPGLNAVEHPVFDVWLTGCVKPERTIAEGGTLDPYQSADQAPQAGDAPAAGSPMPMDDGSDGQRRRVRR